MGLNLTENSNGSIRIEDETTLGAAAVTDIRKAIEANFKADFSFFTSLSTAEANAFGVEFIGL